MRRLLEELGRGRLFSNTSHSNEIVDQYSEAVTKAIIYLQQHKIGALIVFQRSTGLKEIWRSAVHLRSEITQELLLSIFWPNNPLHDGAVIMDRQSIIAAACYLPLTDNNDISRWYGTRHRAAVGVSEVSDALSLVVSEEQGHTSLAIRGRLSRPLSEEQLSRFIRRYFNPALTRSVSSRIAPSKVSGRVAPYSSTGKNVTSYPFLPSHLNVSSTA